jgi:predicted AAA+ superfamily ATPase
MFSRLFKLPQTKSFFLFGARGTGKSTLLENTLKGQKTFWVDFLDLDIEDRYMTRPMLLEEEVLAQGPDHIDWVVIDEVQKVPTILDVVQRLITKQKMRFALTGSSARKLKRGSANLLAGRALQKVLFPLTYVELGEKFDLDFCLNWGSLPEVFALEEDERADYLRTYANTYVKEEIQAEQIIRKILPFKKFLEIAALSSGKILNYSKIARDIGSDAVSVKSYFEILEDTLLGFFLPAYDTSIRKQQSKSPKFYFFDAGVTRALSRTLQLSIRPSTFEYGNAFEQFIINEINRLNLYYQKDWKCTYFRSKDNVEVDLVIERPGKSTLLIEIKSKAMITPEDIRHLKLIAPDITPSESLCLSQDTVAKIIDGVSCTHWQKGLQKIFN